MWLTAWDWDTTGEIGNSISILSDGYRKYAALSNRRARIAIPEPRSGYIEMRGEVMESGSVSISVLSGTQPLALPQMSLEQTIRIQIEVSDGTNRLSASAAAWGVIPGFQLNRASRVGPVSRPVRRRSKSEGGRPNPPCNGRPASAHFCCERATSASTGFHLLCCFWTKAVVSSASIGCV